MSLGSRLFDAVVMIGSVNLAKEWIVSRPRMMTLETG